jgi:uroporphyrinogen-III synthase
MPTPSFAGRRVLAFESRRAREIETLIATHGGRPMLAPAMRELPNESDAAARDFAHALVRGEFDAVVFLTGVGVRALVAAADAAGIRDAFVAALARTRIATRGPKPVAALRELQVPIWVNAPEPNTWRELVAAIDGQSGSWPVTGRRVAVQEYGVPNVELLDALRARGAQVTAIQAYRWAMPEDVEPLREAARAVSRGDIDVLIVTSGIQVVHFWRIARELDLDDAVRQRLSRVLIASIGPSASAELRRYGLEPTFEPAHPKMGQLVREAAERTAGSAG